MPARRVLAVFVLIGLFCRLLPGRSASAQYPGAARTEPANSASAGLPAAGGLSFHVCVNSFGLSRHFFDISVHSVDLSFHFFDISVRRFNIHLCIAFCCRSGLGAVR